jgi:imidazolonepropionase-like amidohydrolase
LVSRLQAALLDSGMVGLRCAGAHQLHGRRLEARLRRRASTWGRRLFAAGHFLTTTGGHFLTSGHALEVDGPYGFVHGHPRADQARRRPHQAEPVGRHSWARPGTCTSTPSCWTDELKAAFDICKLREFKVMAHATNPVAVKAAIQLGAHSIEHGYILDDECIELFLKHGTWYVPTLSISHLTPGQASNEWEKRWVKNRNLAQALCCRADAASGRAPAWISSRR